MTASSEGFTLVRDLPAAPEEVWRAWTDPDLLAHWFHPRGMTTPRESVELDLRSGGRYAYAMVGDDGSRALTGGVYRAVDPLRHLEFTWGDPEQSPDEAPVVDVALADTGEATRLTFTITGAEGHPGDDSFYDGWDQALDGLVDLISSR